MGIETPRLLRWAAGLSFAAAFVHMLVVNEHFTQWWAYGVFFMLASMAQGGYGFFIAMTPLLHGETILQRWPPAALHLFYQAGILANLGLVLVYVLSRTTGIPFLGPGGRTVEPWDPLGVATKGVEVALIVVLVLLLRRAGKPDEAQPPEPAPA